MRAYAERKYLYRNLRNGQFEDVSLVGGSGITANVPARGFAVGDYDNDGNLDAVVNCVNAGPQLLRCVSTLNRNWVKIRLVGTKSNRSGDRRAHQGSGADRHAAAECKTRRRAYADRGSPLLQWLLFGQRPTHPFRPRGREEGRHA